jgi:hypothetical protein
MYLLLKIIMKNLLNISEEEKSRILEMHETATNKQYLSEQTSPSQYQINQVYEGIRVPKGKNVPQDLDSKNQKYTLTIGEVNGRDVWANINGPGVYKGEKFPHKLVLSISIPSEIANGMPSGLCGNMELGCFTQLKRIK